MGKRNDQIREYDRQYTRKRNALLRSLGRCRTCKKKCAPLITCSACNRRRYEQRKHKALWA